MKWITRFFLLITSICLLFTTGCGQKHSTSYRIGVDPLFFPLDFGPQTINIFAFSNELLQEISKIQNIPFTRVNLSWDNLLEGLELHKCDAILSAMPPNLINITKYSFSKPYLKTGPVLIIPKTDKIVTLEDLSRQVLGIEQKDPLLELMSNYPNVEIVFYNQIPAVLDNVSKGRIHACLVPSVPANAFIKDLFHNRLTIVSDPLTNEGLRFVTLKDEKTSLIINFNEGLKKLLKNGTYDKLLDKWIIN